MDHNLDELNSGAACNASNKLQWYVKTKVVIEVERRGDQTRSTTHTQSLVYLQEVASCLRTHLHVLATYSIWPTAGPDGGLRLNHAPS